MEQQQEPKLGKYLVSFLGDYKIGKSLLMVLLLSKLALKSKHQIANICDEHSYLESYYYKGRKKIKEGAFKFIGCEIDTSPSFARLFGNFYERGKTSEVNIEGAKIYINKGLEQVLDEIENGVVITSFSGGTAYANYLKKPVNTINYVFLDRDGKSDDALLELLNFHYDGFLNKISDINSYEQEDKKSFIKTTQRLIHQKYDDTSNIGFTQTFNERSKTLIQAFFISEIKNHMKINNNHEPLSHIIRDYLVNIDSKNLSESSVLTLDQLLLRKGYVSDEFLHRTLSSIKEIRKKIKCNDSVVIKALFEMSMSHSLLEQHFENIYSHDFNRVIARNTVRCNEKFQRYNVDNRTRVSSNAHNLAFFLLEKFLPNRISDIFEIMKQKHYHDHIKKNNYNFLVDVSEANQDLRYIFSNTIPFLLIRGYSKKNIRDIAMKLNIGFADNENNGFIDKVGIIKKRLFEDHDFRNQLIRDYESLSEIIMSQIKPFGENQSALDPKYKKIAIDHNSYSLIQTLESPELEGELVSNIMHLRSVFDPHIFFFGGKLDLSKGSKIMARDLLISQYSEIVDKFDWKPNYIGEFEFNEELELLTDGQIPIFEWSPEEKDNLVKKIENYMKTIKQQGHENQKQANYSEEQKKTKLVSFLKSFTKRNKEKLKQLSPRQREEIRMRAINHYKNKLKSMCDEYKKIFIELNDQFEELSFIPNVENILEILCGTIYEIHNRKNKIQNPEQFDFETFIKDHLIKYKELEMRIKQHSYSRSQEQRTKGVLGYFRKTASQQAP